LDLTGLWQLSLRHASSGLSRREFSATELLDSTLDRARATEPSVHAYVRLIDGCRQAAKTVDREIAAGRYLGPLHGIPLGVKDLFYTAGTATEAGSRVLDGFIPSFDATAVARLKRAGAIVIGKTVTHEFAYGQNVPPTRNPWRLDCYPGGSSAGSGVAVAVGSAFAALGTDTAGSIRIPASVNGVVGLKPTYGRVSRRGVIPMSPTLDAAGPIARTAEDCAFVLNAIAGFDALDPGSVDRPVDDYVDLLNGGLEGMRLGVERTWFMSNGVSQDVTAATEVCLRTMTGLGAQIVEVQIPELEFTLAAGFPVLFADTSAWHRHFLRSVGDRYVQGTRVMLELGELVAAPDYYEAQRARSVIRDSVRRVFEQAGLTALIGPTLPVTTVPLERLDSHLAGEDQSAISLYVHHCFLANVIGIPALTFPCGLSAEGLPIGAQLYGRPFGESALLRIAHSYQQATDWHLRRPPLPR